MVGHYCNGRTYVSKKIASIQMHSTEVIMSHTHTKQMQLTDQWFEQKIHRGCGRGMQYKRYHKSFVHGYLIDFCSFEIVISIWLVLTHTTCLRLQINKGK